MSTAREATTHLADLLRREHHALGEFLLALASFDRERRWVDLGYSSLFSFLTRELRLSAGAAQNRKTAAELVQKYPAVEAALRDTSERLHSFGCESSFMPGDSLPTVFVDFKQLSYCLRTMIMSDIEGHNGGRIDISTYADGDQVVVRVRDTSVRLSQEALDTLLVPFSSTLELGSGLGLALCKTMLEKQGIPFSAQLLPERGIEYTILLPTRKEEQR